MTTEKITAEKNFGVVLLAAGNSSRLGQPKQLLLFKGKTLLQHSIELTAAADTTFTVVVLGANAELLQPCIKDNKVHTVINKRWREGMASSIVCGVRLLKEVDNTIEGFILMVCDQPYVTTFLIDELIRVHRNTGKLIVTCSYGETFGPPALFHKSVFKELMELTGDVGARSIIKKYPGEVEFVPFPEGITDVDTEADYQKIVKG